MTAAPVAGPPDRFVTGKVDSPVVPWNPSMPAPVDQRPYLDYLDRVERGEPTGRARMTQLHPDAPCHTGGGGPLSACSCGRAGWRGDPSGLAQIPAGWAR